MTPIPNSKGYTGVKLDISNLECKTENAIQSVECEKWEIICDSGDKFFFRLATFGEVYELATREYIGDGSTYLPEDYEFRKAPNGVIPCDNITKNANGEVEGIYIFNRHMSNF